MELQSFDDVVWITIHNIDILLIKYWILYLNVQKTFWTKLCQDLLPLSISYIFFEIIKLTSGGSSSFVSEIFNTTLFGSRGFSHPNVIRSTIVLSKSNKTHSIFNYLKLFSVPLSPISFNFSTIHWGSGSLWHLNFSTNLWKSHSNVTWVPQIHWQVGFSPCSPNGVKLL